MGQLFSIRGAVHDICRVRWNEKNVHAYLWILNLNTLVVKYMLKAVSFELQSQLDCMDAMLF